MKLIQIGELKEQTMKKNIHVVGAVIVQAGQIFCAQRNAEQSLPLLWEFPGGKIEQGETAEEALMREVEEELQCEIEVGKRIEHTVYEYDFGVVHLTTFYCRLIAGNPVLLEHAASKWLLPSELYTLEWAPADIPAIDKIILDLG